MVASSSRGVSRGGGARGPRAAEVAEKSRRRAKSGLSRAGPRGAPRAVGGARRRPRRAPEAAGGPPLPKEFRATFSRRPQGRARSGQNFAGAVLAGQRPRRSRPRHRRAGPAASERGERSLADVADPPARARFAQRGGGAADGGAYRTHLHVSLRRGGLYRLVTGPASAGTKSKTAAARGH